MTDQTEIEKLEAAVNKAQPDVTYDDVTLLQKHARAHLAALKGGSVDLEKVRKLLGEAALSFENAEKPDYNAKNWRLNARLCVEKSLAILAPQPAPVADAPAEPESPVDWSEQAADSEGNKQVGVGRSLFQKPVATSADRAAAKAFEELLVVLRADGAPMRAVELCKTIRAALTKPAAGEGAHD